jgi:Fe2+ or Zn2+ uptake regulation protein
MVICHNCGAEVEIPAEIKNAAERWQHKLEVEAKRKAAIRKKDKSYCQIKKIV